MKLMLSKLGGTLRNALEEHPGFCLNITGHSMGAGVALLTTMEILSNKACYIPEETVVQCIALAPPPIYRSDVPLPEEITSCLHIYINSRDCVPRASLGTITCLFSKLRAIDDLDLTPKEQFDLMRGKKDRDTVANQERICAALESVQQEGLKFLEHPGQINFIYRCQPTSVDDKEADAEATLQENYVIVSETSETFSRNFMLRRRMVDDHSLGRYIRKLERAICRYRVGDWYEATMPKKEDEYCEDSEESESSEDSERDDEEPETEDD